MKTFKQQFKQIQKIAMAILFIGLPLFITSCNDDDDDMGGTDDMTIVDIAQKTPELSTLVGALVAADLTDALSGDGPFTVFAPTNAAFNNLPDGVLNNIIANPALLTSLLQYHVVSGDVTSGDLTNGPVQTLLSGQTIDVNISGGMVTLNGDSKVTTADIDASNGVIHIIDEVLFPEDFYAMTLAQIVAGSPDHTILLSALAKPELSDLLAAANDPTQDLTVFAPTNAAFEGVLAALGMNSIDEIPVGVLKEIVTYHILGGAVASDQLSNGDVNTLLPGIPGGPEYEFVTVDLTDGVKLNNSANVTAPDLKAVNGVAHVVDAVLLPSYITYSIGTIAEVVQFNNDFTILNAALRKAELLETVAIAENLTVFAPDNAGFVAADITNLDDYTVEELQDVLKYHVLGAVVKAADLPASGMATTLYNDEKIYLGYLNNQRVLINGLSEIIDVDIVKSNGVIHVINRTMVPPAINVVDIALALADSGEASDFTVLTSLLASEEYSDITDAIIDNENITIFAPTDEAFAAIDNGAGLSPEQISTVLTYHAADARVFSYDLVEGQNIIMLNGQTVKVSAIIDDLITLEDTTDESAGITEVNIHGSNGVIHVVNKVLIPEL